MPSIIPKATGFLVNLARHQLTLSLRHTTLSDDALLGEPPEVPVEDFLRRGIYRLRRHLFSINERVYNTRQVNSMMANSYSLESHLFFSCAQVMHLHNGTGTSCTILLCAGFLYTPIYIDVQNERTAGAACLELGEVSHHLTNLLRHVGHLYRDGFALRSV